MTTLSTWFWIAFLIALLTSPYWHRPKPRRPRYRILTNDQGSFKIQRDPGVGRWADVVTQGVRYLPTFSDAQKAVRHHEQEDACRCGTWRVVK